MHTAKLLKKREKSNFLYVITDIMQNRVIFWAFLLRSRRATGYAVASVRCTMLAHALRMPNAKEVFFMGLMGLPTHPPPSEMS
jgi:hypothetical protein